MGGETQDSGGRLARYQFSPTGPQRDRYWQQGCDMYPAWNAYKKRSPHREFPIMILSREPLVTE